MQFPANLIEKFHHKMGDNASCEEYYLLRDSLARVLFMQASAFGVLLLGILSLYYEYFETWVDSPFYYLFFLGFISVALFLQKKAIDSFRSYKRPGALFAFEDKLFIIWDISQEEHIVHYRNIISVKEIKETQVKFDNMFGENVTIGISIKEKNGKTHKLLYRKMPCQLSSELLHTLYDLDW